MLFAISQTAERGGHEVDRERERHDVGEHQQQKTERLDTVQFMVTDPLSYQAEVVFNYPNPFKTTTYFLVNLTDPASIRLEIFTVSGKSVRVLEQNGAAGEAWIHWDGRDRAGDSIANGTYLYVAQVSFAGLDRPSVVLRGALSKIE